MLRTSGTLRLDAAPPPVAPATAAVVALAEPVAPTLAGPSTVARTVSITVTGPSGSIATYTATDGVTTVRGWAVIGADSFAVVVIDISAFADGNFTISVDVTDVLGNLESAGVKVGKKDTAAPHANAPAVSASSAPGQRTVFISDEELAFAVGDDGPVTIEVSGKPAGNIFPVGTTILTYRVTDGVGNTAVFVQSVTVVERNGAPVLTVAPAQTVGELGTIDLGSFTDLNLGDAWRVVVNWGDGSQETFDVAQTGALRRGHAYADNRAAAFTVTVTVLDRAGASTSGSASVTVVNTAPQATLSTSGTVYEGSGFTLIAAAQDSVADTAAGFAYAFDCGSGYGAWVSNATASCAGSPNETSRSVGVKIRDKDGAISERRQTVAIVNAAAAVTVLSPTATTFAIGQLITVRVSYVDPGASDTHTCSVNWGNGRVTTGSIATPKNGARTCTAVSNYAGNGDFTITVTILDNGGAAAKVSIAVRIGSGSAGGSGTSGASGTFHIASSRQLQIGRRPSGSRFCLASGS